MLPTTVLVLCKTIFHGGSNYELRSKIRICTKIRSVMISILRFTYLQNIYRLHFTFILSIFPSLHFTFILSIFPCLLVLINLTSNVSLTFSKKNVTPIVRRPPQERRKQKTEIIFKRRDFKRNPRERIDHERSYIPVYHRSLSYLSRLFSDSPR